MLILWWKNLCPFYHSFFLVIVLNFCFKFELRDNSQKTSSLLFTCLKWTTYSVQSNLHIVTKVFLAWVAEHRNNSKLKYENLRIFVGFSSLGKIRPARRIYRKSTLIYGRSKSHLTLFNSSWYPFHSTYLSTIRFRERPLRPPWEFIEPI